MKVNRDSIEIIAFQFLLCFLLTWLAASCCLAQETSVEQNATDSAHREIFRLENGLTVILLENHKENKVAVVSFYRAGFMHEPRGKAHISHLVEHMVLQCATKSYEPNESLILLQKKGMANAETLATFVHYDYLLPASDLELALKIESERLTSIKFSEKVLKEEIAKCLQEIEFVQNDPQAGLIKFGLMGFSQAIRFGDKFVPVCGGTSKLTVEDVQEFHKDHYRPESALLVMVGDFESEAAKRMARNYFADIPKGGQEPRPARPAPPVQAGVRVVQMSEDIRAQWDFASEALYLIYPGAPEDFDGRIALTLFGNYLTRCLFFDADLKKVTKISFCSNQLYPVGELPFFVFAEPKQGEALEGVRAALKKAVEEALQDFNTMAFSQIKFGLVSFMRSSFLEGGFAPPHIQYEMLLVQEALYLGIKELLRNGISEEEFLSRIDALDFQAANEIIKTRLSNENEKEVLFMATKERAH